MSNPTTTETRAGTIMRLEVLISSQQYQNKMLQQKFHTMRKTNRHLTSIALLLCVLLAISLFHLGLKAEPN